MTEPKLRSSVRVVCAKCFATTALWHTRTSVEASWVPELNNTTGWELIEGRWYCPRDAAVVRKAKGMPP